MGWRWKSFLAAVLLLAAGCGGVSVDPPDPGGGLGAAEQADRGADALRAFVAAINDRDTAAYAEAIDARFADQLEPVPDNADLLEVGTISAEYVDSVPGGLAEDDVATYGAEAWLGTARLRYTLAVDGAEASHETALVLVPDGAGARVAAVGGHGLRSPLWLTGPIELASRDRVTVINAGGRASADYLQRGLRAVRDVRQTLPDWDGHLVIEVPRDKAGLDDVLGADANTYANIAAVTTTVDGRDVVGTPIHVYLNPELFGGLKARGAQVVVSHEATHVATGASFTAMPIWLLEGFADYVALKPSGVPVQRAAAQVIKRMRAEGLPDDLPAPEDLQPTAADLGATYEEAWLACRFIAQHWGENSLIRVYELVADGAELKSAFRQALGVDPARFVQLWRADLDKLVNR